MHSGKKRRPAVICPNRVERQMHELPDEMPSRGGDRVASDGRSRPSLNKPAAIDRHGYSRAVRRRSEFEMTATELNAIAAPAMIGLSSQPKKG